MSDLTLTGFGKDTASGSGEQIQTRHETFYLEDGNAGIMRGHAVFLVRPPSLRCGICRLTLMTRFPARKRFQSLPYSLPLQMMIKCGFYDVCEALVEDIF